MAKNVIKYIVVENNDLVNIIDSIEKIESLMIDAKQKADYFITINRELSKYFYGKYRAYRIILKLLKGEK